jgi:hypothetical protein
MRISTGRLAALLFLLLGAACTEDTPPRTLVAPCGQGTIEIHVLSPVRPGSLKITMTSMEYDQEFRAETMTDSTGALVQHVPYGLYRLAVGPGELESWTTYYVSHGRAVAYQDAETLAVGFPEERLRVDLVLGALEIRLKAPPSLDGQEMSCDARLIADHLSQYYHATALCQAGVAVLSFRAVVPGQYRVTAGLGNDVSWMPAGGAGRMGELLSVEAGLQTVRELSLVRAAVLRGDLRGAHQAVSHLYLGGSAITAVTPDSVEVGWTSIPEQGTWMMTANPPGPVRLRLVSGGITRWIGGADFGSATEFMAVAGETLQVPEEEESAIVLRLHGPRDEISYNPLIEVRDAAGTLLAQLGDRCDLCPAGDRFAVGNLHPGSYYLRVQPGSTDLRDTWSAAWFDQAGTMAEATPVRVSFAGEIVPVDVRLWPAAVIRGRLLAVPPGSSSVSQVGITAASDTLGLLATRNLDVPTEPFTFSGMEPASYLLFARVRRSYQTRRWWYPGTWSAVQARPVEVEAPGQEQDIEWSLPR